MAHHHSLRLLALTLVAAALLLSPANAAGVKDTYSDCVAAFNKLGGREGITKRLPSCQSGFSAIRACCGEAKSMLQLGPGNCLCDARVYAEVERQILEANISGLTKQTLTMFTNFCGINNYGAGTC